MDGLLTSSLAYRALAVTRAMLGLGHEVFDANGATFVRNRDLPGIWEANHVTGVTAASADDIDCLLARVERDTPKDAYARMGFRPVAVMREYLRHVSPS